MRSELGADYSRQSPEYKRTPSENKADRGPSFAYEWIAHHIDFVAENGSDLTKRGEAISELERHLEYLSEPNIPDEEAMYPLDLDACKRWLDGQRHALEQEHSVCRLLKGKGIMLDEANAALAIHENVHQTLDGACSTAIRHHESTCQDTFDDTLVSIRGGMYDDLEADFGNVISDDDHGEQNVRSRDGSHAKATKGSKNAHRHDDHDDEIFEKYTGFRINHITCSDTKVSTTDTGSVSRFEATLPYNSLASFTEASGSQYQMPRPKGIGGRHKIRTPSDGSGPASGFLSVAPEPQDSPRPAIGGERFVFLDPENTKPTKPSVTWNTRDAATGKVTSGRAGGKKKLSSDPDALENQPLHVVLGLKAKHADDIPVQQDPQTEDNLDRVNRKGRQPKSLKASPSFRPAFSASGSEALSAAPAPSDVAMSDLRPVDVDERSSAASVLSFSTASDNSYTSEKTVRPIHPDIEKNFVSANKVYNIQKGPSEFEMLNCNLLASSSATSYSVAFSAGNEVVFAATTDDRIKHLDTQGNYVGRNQGHLPKRQRLGLIEAREAREREMRQASVEYRGWLMLTVDERVHRLQQIRKPYAGVGVFSEEDVQEFLDINDFPAMYKRTECRREMNRRKAARDRMLRDLPKRPAGPESAESAESARSTHSERSTITVDTVGQLGDLDGPLLYPGEESVEAASQTTRNTDTTMRRIFASLTGSRYEAHVPRHSRGPRNQQNRSDVNCSRGSSQATRRGGPATGHSSANRHPNSRLRMAKPGPVLLDSRTGYSTVPPRSVNSQNGRQFMGPPPSWAGNVSSHAASTRGHTGTESVCRGVYFEDILGYDDGPQLQMPEDATFGPLDLDEDQMAYCQLASAHSLERGRVVVIRLHEGPTFSGTLIASRVFGAQVQEIQLFPAQRMAIIVFLFPTEARAYLQHICQVRRRGTEQEIRELQVEAAWYKGSERMAILDPQPNIIKYSSQEASRCIAIYNISTTKTYKEVSQELGQRLGKLMLFMKMTSPKAYEDRLKGRTAYIEFASLVDAVGAYQDFMDQSVTGYESANPEFWQEKSSIQASQKPYCPCLGCEDRRQKEESDRQNMIQAMREAYKAASNTTSGLGGGPQTTSVVSGSVAISSGKGYLIELSASESGNLASTNSVAGEAQVDENWF